MIVSRVLTAKKKRKRHDSLRLRPPHPRPGKMPAFYCGPLLTILKNAHRPSMEIKLRLRLLAAGALPQHPVSKRGLWPQLDRYPAPSIPRSLGGAGQGETEAGYGQAGRQSQADKCWPSQLTSIPGFPGT